MPVSTGASPGGYVPPGGGSGPTPLPLGGGGGPLGFGGGPSNTLDEPVWETVKRDLLRIYKNLVMVVFPFKDRSQQSVCRGCCAAGGVGASSEPRLGCRQPRRLPATGGTCS